MKQDIFNPVPAEVLPKIKITDLLPQSHIEGDPEHEFVLPLEMYRKHIAGGVHKLAANRRAHLHVRIRAGRLCLLSLYRRWGTCRRGKESGRVVVESMVQVMCARYR